MKSLIVSKKEKIKISAPRRSNQEQTHKRNACKLHFDNEDTVDREKRSKEAITQGTLNNWMPWKRQTNEMNAEGTSNEKRTHKRNAYKLQITNEDAVDRVKRSKEVNTQGTLNDCVLKKSKQSRWTPKEHLLRDEHTKCMNAHKTANSKWRSSWP